MATLRPSYFSVLLFSVTTQQVSTSGTHLPFTLPTPLFCPSPNHGAPVLILNLFHWTLVILITVLIITAGDNNNDGVDDDRMLLSAPGIQATPSNPANEDTTSLQLSQDAAADSTVPGVSRNLENMFNYFFALRYNF